jgi:hypothetical protein
VTLFVFVVVTAAVMAVAALAVGRAARRLAAQEPASLFEFDEAVEFVATALPAEVAGRLGYGDVRTILAAHLRELGEREDAGEDVVFVDDEIEALVAGRPDVVARDLSPADVHAVLAAEAEYLEAIGAVGDVAAEERPEAGAGGAVTGDGE